MEKYRELIGVIDHKVVGKDVTIIGDDEPASSGHAVRSILRTLVLTEGVCPPRGARRRSPASLDPYHRGCDGPGDVDKRVAEVERRLHGLDRDLRLGPNLGHDV